MKNSPPPSLRRPDGFTLIELLTVIAIIGILAAIIIPTVGMMKKKARQSHSLSNVRTIGQGFLLYAGDNKDRLLIQQDTDSARPFWSQKLSPYIGAVRKGLKAFNGSSYELSVTMVDPMLDDNLHHPYGDYGCNTSVIYLSRLNLPPATLYMIKNPSRLVSVMTSSETRSDGTVVGTWYVEAEAYVSRPSTFSSYQPVGRDGGPVLAAFFDGGARAIPQAKFLENRRSLLLNE